MTSYKNPILISERNRTFQCQESVQCEDTLHCIRGTCQCYVAEYWTQTACAKSKVKFHMNLSSIQINKTPLYQLLE